jgi:hypothetical protein
MIRSPSYRWKFLMGGLVVSRRERHQVFYLLAMQWIPFWGSDWTLSMGIFITEGGRNWGWRKTVGKADKHHQHNHFGFLTKMENTYIYSVQATNLFTSRLSSYRLLQTCWGPLRGNGHS